MKYLVKVRETQEWLVWYEVDAESADEATDLCEDGDIYYQEKIDTIDNEFLEVELHEN